MTQARIKNLAPPVPTIPQRRAYMAAYKHELRARFAWAEDQEKLLRFLHAVRDTLKGRANVWQPSGDAAVAAWHAIGMTGRPTLKQMRLMSGAGDDVSEDSK